MSKILSTIITVAVIITTVLFFININEKNGVFFYNLAFTLLFQTLVILWLGFTAFQKNLPVTIRVAFLLFVMISAFVQFFTLFGGPFFFKLVPISRVMTTILLIQAGVEIAVCFTLFAIGNALSKS